MTSDTALFPMSSTIIIKELSHVLSTPPNGIDLHIGFVQNGGDSFAAVRLRSRCKQHGILLGVDEVLSCNSLIEMIATASTISIDPQNHSSSFAVGVPIKSNISAHHRLVSKPAFEPHRCTQVHAATNSAGRAWEPELSTPMCTIELAIGSNTDHDIQIEYEQLPTAPLTEMQLMFIYESLHQPRTSFIHYFETYHPSDIPRMMEAWRLIHATEPLFAIIVDVKNRTMVQHPKTLPLQWEETLISSEHEYEESLKTPTHANTISSFLKVYHLECSNPRRSESTIVWTIHHALIDGFSSRRILRNLRKAVSGLSVKASPSFIPLARELSELQLSQRDSLERFWLTKLSHSSKFEGILRFPPVQTRHEELRISQKTCSASSQQVHRLVSSSNLRQFSRNSGATLATLAISAWAICLSIYTQSSDVVFGGVFSGRTLPLQDVEESVGMLINILPLFLSVDREVGVKDFVRYIESMIAEASTVQHSTTQHGFTREFQSTVGVPLEDPGWPNDLKITTQEHPIPLREPKTVVQTSMPLSIQLSHGGNLDIVYLTENFQDEEIQDLADILVCIISSLIQWPGQFEQPSTIGNILDSALPSDAVDGLLLLGNAIATSTRNHSIGTDLVMLFESSARQYPYNFAVQKGSQKLTYSELDQTASQLAVTLRRLLPSSRSKSRRRGDPSRGLVICVHADQSINWIISIYAVLKAGAIYCPLDAALPFAVRDRHFELAGGEIFIIPSTPENVVAPKSCTSIVCVDDMIKSMAYKKHELMAPRLPHRVNPRPQASAYLCFTSGSTGTPKGVICRHASLVAFQSSLEVRLFAGPDQSIAQIMSPAFDGSIHEIFSALSYGAKLVLRRSRDPFEVLEHVHSAILTPSVAKVLDPDAYPHLENVYLVGEQVSPAVRDRWAERTRLYNMYGPTEGTCGATIKRLLPLTPITVGAPNPTTRVYILSPETNQLCPRGVVGEIVLAGVQIATYLDASSSKSIAFDTDKVLPFLRERMYRTGDRGFWSSSGELVCIGRADRQIKLKGFRLDLDDLEIRIQSAYPAIKSLGIARNSDSLVCMVTPSSVDLGKLKKTLASVLPAHAVPSNIVAVDQLPLTTAGKTDMKAIAQTELPASVFFSRALTHTERKIADVWQSVLPLLQVSRLEPDSSFSDLGGDSIGRLMLSLKLSMAFGFAVSLRKIAKFNTLGSLASAVDAMMASVHRSPQPQSRANLPIQMSISTSSVSYIELEWFKRYQHNPSATTFNVGCVYIIPQDSSIQKLHRCWNTVLAHHPILASTFHIDQETGSVIRRFSTYPPLARLADTIDTWNEVNQPFDLVEGPLIRVVISPTVMSVVISHIICDYTALGILLQHVSRLYMHQEGNTALELEASLPYNQASLWARRGDSLEKDFWKQYLSTYSNNVPLSGARFGDCVPYFQGTSAFSIVPTVIVDKMNTLVSKSATTSHNIALAAVAIVLASLSSTDSSVAASPSSASTDALDIDSLPSESTEGSVLDSPIGHSFVLGAPYMNRHTAEDLQTVGLFLEPIPIRVDLPTQEYDSASEATSHFLESVHSSSSAALSHAMPYYELLELLDDASLCRGQQSTLCTYMVSFHNSPPGKSLPLFSRPLCTYAQGAKFPLMFEFTQSSTGQIILRIEYQYSAFSADEVNSISRATIKALELLAQTYGEVRSEKHKNTGLKDGRVDGCSSLTYGDGMIRSVYDMVKLVKSTPCDDIASGLLEKQSQSFFGMSFD